MKINIFDWESTFFVPASVHVFDFDFVCCSVQGQRPVKGQGAAPSLRMTVDLSSSPRQLATRSSAIAILMKLSCGTRPSLLLARERGEVTKFAFSTILTSGSEYFSRVVYMCLLIALPLLMKRAAISASDVDETGKFSKCLFELDAAFKLLASFQLLEFRDPVHFYLHFSIPFLSAGSRASSVFLFRILNLLKFNEQ